MGVHIKRWAARQLSAPTAPSPSSASAVRAVPCTRLQGTPVLVLVRHKVRVVPEISSGWTPVKKNRGTVNLSAKSYHCPKEPQRSWVDLETICLPQMMFPSLLVLVLHSVPQCLSACIDSICTADTSHIISPFRKMHTFWEAVFLSWDSVLYLLQKGFVFDIQRLANEHQSCFVQYKTKPSSQKL